MSRKLFDFLSKDLVYKQNPDKSYIIDNGNFVLENRNEVIDTILNVLHTIYSNLIKLKQVNPGRIECDEYLVDQVLTRYSRDIYGEIRLKAKIDWLQNAGRITESQREWLTEFDDYGLKIDSCSPYLHRKIANLLYWLSVLKPFSIYAESNSIVNPLGVAFEFHNEYISYMLVLALLKPYSMTLSLHTNRIQFYDFLYELHFRNLSRSSMEFFINAYVHRIEEP